MTPTTRPSTELPIQAVATFTASRDELLGFDSLVGAAERARTVCRGAQRSVSVFGVTAERMRRLDGWLDHVGFVTQAVAGTTSTPVVGSLSSRVHASDVLHKVIDAMVGDMPVNPATEPAEHDLRALGAATMPADAEWFVLVLIAEGVDMPFSDGIAAVSACGTLATASFSSLRDPVRFDGAARDHWTALVDGLLASSQPSLSELLADDVVG